MIEYYPIHPTLPTRRNDVEPRTRYSAYKKDLRMDFSKLCGYCGTSDHYSGGQRGYHIDHFAPKKKFEHLTHSYHNLVYSCPICNLGKSDHWPGDDPTISYVADVGFVDPCLPAYPEHLARNQAGQIIALTPLGEYIRKQLKLSLKRREICWLLDKMESQALILSSMIANDEQDRDLLVAFHKIASSYLKYVGILKSE